MIKKQLPTFERVGFAPPLMTNLAKLFSQRSFIEHLSRSDFFDQMPKNHCFGQGHWQRQKIFNLIFDTVFDVVKKNSLHLRPILKK